MSRKRQLPDDLVVRELNAIRRLLMLQLIADGVPASDIALALGTARSSVSETIPFRRLACAKKGEGS